MGRVAIERFGVVPSAAVRAVHGRGLMIGVELRVPVTPLVIELQARGVLVLAAGRSVIRLLPPLVIEDRAWRDALDVVAEVIGGD